ncbi:GNAT family N-acetyltransferase [Fulvivirga sp. M361]|uniref:GNAT family N-acetyltransferase n=1 Tax=Fulvivirga sp. M361 TaxID=2594266 RepID=UPI00117B87B3|nr:GNAT family N-acetyltransferase [Fulvivirga sp. M361]TRX48598.1 GNAT family N-acetyltransferase [Fulvivirga sp. M361]
MNKATLSNKALVLDIISRSFHQNPSVNDVIKQDHLREKRIEELISYSFDVCMLFGEVWISEDRSAAAMILLSDQKKTTLRSVLLDLRLAIKAIGIRRVLKVMGREKQIKQYYTDYSYVYIWFIGVDPDQQQKGVGSLLLQQIIKHYSDSSLPFYLETSVNRNLPWYSSFGFQVYHKIDMGYDLYLLKKAIQ